MHHESIILDIASNKMLNNVGVMTIVRVRNTCTLSQIIKGKTSTILPKWIYYYNDTLIYHESIILDIASNKMLNNVDVITII